MKKIQDIIDKALEPKPRIRSGKWNPSSFGYCYRSQFWNRKDEPKSNPPDARSMRVFEVGKLFHDFVQDLMFKQEPCQLEVAIETEDVKGFADIVRSTEVAELKSQHSKSFWWMLKKDCDIRKEKYSNWLQVMYYAGKLEKGYGRLVFISKDDLAIQEYVQPLDDYWIGEVKNELAMLREIWERGILPEAIPRCKHTYNKKTKICSYWHCTYCGWKDKCEKLEDVDWPPTKMKREIEKG